MGILCGDCSPNRVGHIARGDSGVSNVCRTEAHNAADKRPFQRLNSESLLAFDEISAL